MVMRCTSANLILLISILFCVGNSSGEESKRVKEELHITALAVYTTSHSMRIAEYHNLEECIKATRKITGSTLEIIVDQPTEVTGFLSSGEHFGCVEKVTDDKGNYVDGWYTIK